MSTETTLAFPLRLGFNGRFAQATTKNSQDVSRIVLTLGTQQGERVMRPEFGEDIQQLFYISERDVPSTIYSVVSKSFEKHFPQLTLVDCRIRSTDSGATMLADVNWRPKDTTGYGSSGSEVFTASVDVSGSIQRIGNE